MYDGREELAVAYETLETEREGALLRVWLNRPERRNAVNNAMLRELGDLFLRLETEFETRVVVLGGRGKSFCAGADLRPPDSASTPSHEPGEREARWLAQLGRRACRAIEESEVVTVARVHGHAIGGGCCFALSCDFRIATRDTIFRIPEVDLGVPLSWAAAPRLIQEVGTARARELLLLCRDVDGAAAERFGLVHRAVAVDRLDEEVGAWVDELLDKPELAVHMTKTQLRGYAQLTALGDASESDGDLISNARRSPTARARFTMPKRDR